MSQAPPPCCHALNPGRKASPKVDFGAELRRQAAPGHAEAAARLASLLTDARNALRLETLAGSDDRFGSVDDIAAFVQQLVVYLSLVKGFSSSPSTETPTVPNSTAVTDTPADPSSSTVTDTTAEALRQPLVDESEAPTAEPVKQEEQPPIKQESRSACLNFCRWSDALSDAQVVALNARQEYAQTLLASGIFLMNVARVKTDALLSQRLNELDEAQLKLAYQLMLHAAGLLEDCLKSIGVVPRSIGAAAVDLDESAGGEASVEQVLVDGDAMVKWRDEQRQAQQHGAETDEDARKDLELLDRVPDLANGHFPQLLQWLALAQAQELVLLRGVSREFVDNALMARLAVDLSSRYKECATFAARSLPCATSQVADRARLYCAFKSPYYLTLSVYFQGAAAMSKDEAAGCALAIADFKKAKAFVIQQAVPREQEYERKLATQKEEKERVSLLHDVFQRLPQVIDRDLDIMTHRNDSVYYEPVPAPDAPADPLGLVRAVAVPLIQSNPIWSDREVATSLQPPKPGQADAEVSSKPREGCCQSCTIM